MQLGRSKLGTIPAGPEGVILPLQDNNCPSHACRVAFEGMCCQLPHIVLGYQIDRA